MEIIDNANRSVQQLKFVVIPRSLEMASEATVFYNKAFAYWQSFWTGVLTANGSSETLNPYDFLRADMVSMLMCEDEIVSMHLYTLFNLQLDGAEFLPYFRGENEKIFLTELRKHEVSTAISFEYLTIDPAWRKNKMRLPMASIVAGLSIDLQQSLQIGAALGRCRQDVKSNILMFERGGIALKRDIMMHNTLTDFCALFLERIVPHPDPNVREIVDQLWSTRIDYLTEQPIYTNNVLKFEPSSTRRAA